MKRFICVLAVIVLLFFSCENNTEKVDHLKQINKCQENCYTLQVLDTLSINLDKRTRYNGRFKLETIDSSEFVCVLDDNKTNYSLYNLETKELYKKIKFKQTGPNGIGEASFVLIHNWDSIFIPRLQTNLLYLLDSSANVKQKWSLENNSTGKHIFNINAAFLFPLYYENNQIYLRNIPPVKAFTDLFWEANLGIRFNLDNGEVYNYNGHFPAVYKNGICYGSYNISQSRILTKQKREVYSFSMDNNLYIYNDTALVKTVSLRSPYVPVDAPEPQKKLTGYNQNDDLLYEIQRGSYRWMVYDEHRDIIYRLVLHAMEPYDIDGNMNKFWDKPFSIQIIDSTFNLVGEVDFPCNTYDFRNIIPTKAGLLISLCHDNNPILEEDKLKLALFKLVNTNE